MKDSSWIYIYSKVNCRVWDFLDTLYIIRDIIDYFCLPSSLLSSHCRTLVLGEVRWTTHGVLSWREMARETLFMLPKQAVVEEVNITWPGWRLLKLWIRLIVVFILLFVVFKDSDIPFLYLKEIIITESIKFSSWTETWNSIMGLIQ